jgi:hypothetical protein
MTIKASGRSALMAAAGLLICLAGPSQAAVTDGAAKPATAKAPVALKYARHATHHLRKYAHHRPGKVALKSLADSKPDAVDDGDHATVLPPSVANANAQLAQADAPSGNAAQAMAARANNLLQAAPDKPVDAQAQPTADTQVGWPDPLKEGDRAQRDRAPASAVVAVASTEAQAAPAAPATANGSESSTWDQTSLIGKIFIGFGALLTMASAARMFMA